MKRISKKIVSVFGILTLLAFIIMPFTRIKNVYATPEKVWLIFDSANVSGNVITFDVEGTDVTATVSGEGYSWTDSKLEIIYSSIRDVKITLDSNYNGMKVQTHTGEEVVTTNEREMVIGDIDFTTDDMMHIQIVKNGSSGGSNTQDFQGNSSATLNYKITGEIDYDDGNGYDYGIGFYINNIQYKADDSKAIVTSSSLDITGDVIHYDATGNTVNFTFVMAPGTLMTGLKINDHVVTGLPDEPAELEACYTDHRLDIPVNGIEKASTYIIEIEARFPDASEEFMSSFLWDYNPQGYTAADDKILHGTLEFVKAEYNGHTYTTVSEINALGGVYLWKDAERKENYADDRDGLGEAQFPKGTVLTVKIIPDAGYQLVSFGLNGGTFTPQNEIGTYTFDVMSGPFHLQADIQKVDDIVNSTTGKVTAGAITLGNEASMSVGTARLDVKDANLSDEQIGKFEEAASGYEVEDYLDISLYNTVYKGSANNTWDTKVETLNNNAEISLQLDDNVNGKDIIVVHETHNGQYEVIDVNYLEQYNAIVFETDSFSNYAIATRGEAETVMHTITFDSNGGSAVPAAVVAHSSILERPTEPTKNGYTFGGWYIEPEFNYSFDFESPIEGDFTLYARWIDNNNLKDYTVTDDNGNSISFTDEEGHNYKFTLFDILSLSKEEIKAMAGDISDEEYDQMMELLKGLAKPTGTLLKLYEIEVYEDNSVTGDTTSLHEGPFKIKIKITDDMKKYNTFRLVYIKNDFTTGEVINLTVEDGYLVGTIPHLSTYMLTGSNTTNPKTGDNVLIYLGIIMASVVALIGFGFYSISDKKTR